LRTLKPRILIGGQLNSDGSSFTGYIKDLIIYNKYYSPKFILSQKLKLHFNNSAENPNIIAYWRLNDSFANGTNDYKFTDSSRFKQVF